MSSLSNEDLAHLLSMQPKDLRKLCGKLREDRLLAVHSRQEIREGLQRPINRDYYYIDFHATIDAIKYRVLQLTTRVKQMFKPSEEKKDYCCPRCKAQWTQLEVLDSVGPTGFLCHRCGGPLEREEPTAGDNTGSEKQVKLAAQLERVLKLLQEIDNATIPKNDFETALSLQIPVQRNKDVNPIRNTVPLETSRAPQTTVVKGINQPIVQDLTVDLTSSTEKTAAEKASEEDRKAAIAAQNALPVWHTHSTVTAGGSAAATDTTIADLKRDPALAAAAADSTKIQAAAAFEDDNKTTTITAPLDETDELAAYYARMAQEKEKEEREDREDEEESSGVEDEEEEDDDEFEDVGIVDPMPSTSSQLNLKEEETGNLNLKPLPNGMSQEYNEPVSDSGMAVVDNDGPAAKRVKVEEAANGSTDVVGNAAVSDEDEEAEFEDAL
ncbi:MAG: hypothetical protein Q9225_000359 [Loekoesia sp. 1 TL-2023]